jgi:hypothetical protein
MTKASASTKADLLEMLAEAVRNTQPQPVNTPPETIRNTQSQRVRNEQPERKRNTQLRKTRPAPKRTVKIKMVRASASRKRQRR